MWLTIGLHTYSVEAEPFLFNAENWFVAQELVVNALDNDVILESPYGSLLRVTALNEMIDVNITLIIREEDSGEFNTGNTCATVSQTQRHTDN